MKLFLCVKNLCVFIPVKHQVVFIRRMWDSITSGHSRFTETCRDGQTKCERTDSELSICIWITRDGCCVIPKCEQAPSVCRSEPQKYRAINNLVIITAAIYFLATLWFVTSCVVKWGMTAYFCLGPVFDVPFERNFKARGWAPVGTDVLQRVERVCCYGRRYEAFHCGAEEETAGQYRSQS